MGSRLTYWYLITQHPGPCNDHSCVFQLLIILSRTIPKDDCLRIFSVYMYANW